MSGHHLSCSWVCYPLLMAVHADVGSETFGQLHCKMCPMIMHTLSGSSSSGVRFHMSMPSTSAAASPESPSVRLPSTLWCAGHLGCTPPGRCSYPKLGDGLSVEGDLQTRCVRSTPAFDISAHRSRFPYTCMYSTVEKFIPERRMCPTCIRPDEAQMHMPFADEFKQSHF